MAWVPAAIEGGSSILGGMIGNKGAKQDANDAANAQMKLANQMFDKETAYQQQQQGQQRQAIAGLLSGGNPFFQVGGQLHPQYDAPGSNAAMFGSASAPGTFSMGGGPTENPFTGMGAGGGGGAGAPRSTQPVAQRGEPTNPIQAGPGTVRAQPPGFGPPQGLPPGPHQGLPNAPTPFAPPQAGPGGRPPGLNLRHLLSFNGNPFAGMSV